MSETAEPSGLGEIGGQPLVVVLGHGEWMIGHGVTEGAPALYIGKPTTPGIVGETPSPEDLKHAADHGPQICVVFANSGAVLQFMDEFKAMMLDFAKEIQDEQEGGAA